ncbi:MAG: hypothetical protein ACK4RN_07145 [Pseudorhodobacter sp.]
MFSRTDLTTLIEGVPALAVSVYLPTQTQGRETRQNPIMLKNLLVEARAHLAAQEISGQEIEALLAPADNLVEDYDFWQHQDPGLALFLSDAGLQAHRLPIAVPELAVAGPGFHIVPLLPLQEKDAAFLILTMTADAASVWQATRFSITATEIADLPDSIESLDTVPDYEGSLQSHGFGRPNTGGQSMPKTQVYGDSPEEWRKGRLVEFARRASMAVAAHLARDPQPLVVVADAAIGGHVRNDEALAQMIAGFVEVNPATLDEASLLGAAMAVMQPIHDRSRDEALERLDAQLGRGDTTACIDPDQLIAAAREGRVDQFFVGEDAVRRGSSDPQEGDSASRGQDPVNQTAKMTLRNGGTVWVVAQDRLPDDIAMAATLRY